MNLTISIIYLLAKFDLIIGPMFIEMDSQPGSWCECLSRIEPKQHLTLVFNSFVVMTLCNEINSRKIHAERNVFEGIFRNYLFCVIWVICFIAQILIVNFGTYGFACKPLSMEQWFWSILFGIGSLMWAQV